MNGTNPFVPNARYRQLDLREQELKRELEIVRAEKRQITMSQFFGSAPKETTDDILRAIRRTGASTSAREPLTLNSVLP